MTMIQQHPTAGFSPSLPRFCDARTSHISAGQQQSGRPWPPDRTHGIPWASLGQAGWSLWRSVKLIQLFSQIPVRSTIFLGFHVPSHSLYIGLSPFFPLRIALCGIPHVWTNCFKTKHHTSLLSPLGQRRGLSALDVLKLQDAQPGREWTHRKWERERERYPIDNAFSLVLGGNDLPKKGTRGALFSFVSEQAHQEFG